ncbi:hypothetical protein HAX54_041671 [Datura stramonium]|uniref:Uncharacterized protein n=1 Tax=Datura stramonium TaxID=4076 RepID=A0ABS8W290_DATST|nr:hypothetical protein [Datura stramonium]
MEEDEQKQLVLCTTSEPLVSESNSMTSATLGRVINTLLTSKPKKLLDTISHLDPSPKIAPIGVSLEQSLWFLYKYVKDAAEKESSLDQVLVPMIQHVTTKQLFLFVELKFLGFTTD